MNIEHYTRVGRLLAELHGDEVLSEQQCAKIMGVDLVSWRIIEHTFCRGSWGETVDESGPTSEEAILDALASTEAAGEPVPSDCDVRKILLRVVPGDGDGYEVYAKNVDDVENLLSEMGERLENFELARTTPPPAKLSTETVDKAVDRLTPRVKAVLEAFMVTYRCKNWEGDWAYQEADALLAATEKERAPNA